MNELEKILLSEEVGDAEPRLCIRSRASIDAGRWWRGTPVWLCVVGQDLVMLAVARRKYVAKVAITACPDSHYDHASGELIIEPGEALRFNRFKISPREAILILRILNPASVCRKLQNR